MILLCLLESALLHCVSFLWCKKAKILLDKCKRSLHCRKTGLHLAVSYGFKSTDPIAFRVHCREWIFPHNLILGSVLPLCAATLQLFLCSLKWLLSIAVCSAAARKWNVALHYFFIPWILFWNNHSSYFRVRCMDVCLLWLLSDWSTTVESACIYNCTC